MGVVAVPHMGGRGIGMLLRFLVHLAMWHIVFHAMRGFLVQYTHIPWLGTLIIVIIAVALIRFAMSHHRR